MSETTVKAVKTKIAVVLFNLGGPNNLSSVKDFLFSLFYDKYIINSPNPLRYLIAKLISLTRNKKAKEIYSLIGGKSPILEETLKQKDYLQKYLKEDSDFIYDVFVCMRHSYPRSQDVVRELKIHQYDKVILLPLYPQFSTTTTLSAIEHFKQAIKDFGIKSQLQTICCYPNDSNFIEATTNIIKEHINKITDKNNMRILFSAHSLPVKIIENGDPYQWQIEQTVLSVIRKLNINNLDYKITYQSKVGPVKWLEPATEKEIIVACRENKNIVIVPIAFVSEHVETLVELDIEYFNITKEYNIEYVRVPTLSCNELFIKSLAEIVFKFTRSKKEFISNSYFNRVCPSKFTQCPCKIE